MSALRRLRVPDDAVAPVILAVYLLGFAAGGFLQLDEWRAALVGPDPVDPVAAVGLAVAVSLVAWSSLARRHAVWLSPAYLTWRDVDDRRVGMIRRRLVVAWGLRVGLIGYVWAMAAALAEVPTGVWLVGSAVGAGAAVAVLLALGPARTARRAGRAELVAGWRQRTVRSGAVRFLDPMLLLDAARPLGLSLAGSAVLRFLVLEGADRGHALLTAVLVLAVAIAVLQVAPAVSASAVLAVLGYVGLLPAGRGLGRLWRYPGLRRWVGAGDQRLRWTGAAVVAVPATAFCAAAIPFGAPVAVLAAVPIVVGAVIRTVTRPIPRYAFIRPGLAVTPGVLQGAGVRLALQTLRGADLLAVGVAVLVVGVAPWLTVLLVGALGVDGIVR